MSDRRVRLRVAEGLPAAIRLSAGAAPPWKCGRPDRRGRTRLLLFYVHPVVRRAVVILAAALALVAGAQQHPNQEKGFDPTKLYHFTDIDSINTFNGNLIVTLPVTPTFRAGPLLAYSFTPVYNANVWDARQVENNTTGGTVRKLSLTRRGVPRHHQA